MNAGVPPGALTFASVVGQPARPSGLVVTRRGAATGTEADLDAAAPGVPPGGWRLGLCGCLANLWSCLGVCFCEPCSVGQVTSISRGGSAQACLYVSVMVFFFLVLGTTLELAGRGAVATVGAVVSVIGGLLVFGAVCIARGRVRLNNQIAGSSFGDCLASFFCAPCSMCQIINHYAPYRNPFSTYDPLAVEDTEAKALATAV